MERAAVEGNRVSNLAEAREIEREWRREVTGRGAAISAWAEQATGDGKRVAALRSWLMEMKRKEVEGLVVPGQVPPAWVITIRQCQGTLEGLGHALATYKALCDDESAAYDDMKRLFQESDAPSLSNVNDSNVRRLRVRAAIAKVAADIHRKFDFITECDLTAIYEQARAVHQSVNEAEQAARVKRSLEEVEAFVEQPGRGPQPPAAPVRAALPLSVRKKVIPSVRSALFPDYETPFADMADAERRLRPYCYLPLISGAMEAPSKRDESAVAAERAALLAFHDELRLGAADHLSDEHPTDAYYTLESLHLRRQQDRVADLRNLLATAHDDPASFLDRARKLLPTPETLRAPEQGPPPPASESPPPVSVQTPGPPAKKQRKADLVIRFGG
ncbi:hypothetical protein DIPPA_29339 [Diplonema papillatum]|nr:hypothetical protein DIPPA_29339 [Diplonema papillatum]